jgi:hypothetical protein
MGRYALSVPCIPVELSSSSHPSTHPPAKKRLHSEIVAFIKWINPAEIQSTAKRPSTSLCLDSSHQPTFESNASRPLNPSSFSDQNPWLTAKPAPRMPILRRCRDWVDRNFGICIPQESSDDPTHPLNRVDNRNCKIPYILLSLQFQ